MRFPRVWASFVGCLALSLAPAARADDTRAEMHRYFDGELAEGWVFSSVGAAGLGLGGAGLFAKDDLYRGAAYPVLAISAVQLAAGLVLLSRTAGQVAERDRLLDVEPGAFRALEGPRMKKVRSEFTLLYGLELGLAAVGVGLATYGGFRREHLPTGIGLGLAFESALMLAFDGQASARADRYADVIGR